MNEPHRLSKLSDQILQMMLQEYAERLRQSNSLIWVASSAFLPVSLAGIAIYEITGREWTVTLVGLASIILIWLWYLISTRFRAFINHDRAIYQEIESELLIREKATFKNFDDLYPVGTNLSLKILRTLLPVSVTVFWAISISTAWLL
ncbi:hypothetical protein [Floridanema evergladense]|uniref:Uncharacterized protein n=1 Tax=Floridaenema evergladense BLCC-F167 TaxID=3153639 RepID=A0ABV4WS20_9CYAN